jgi:hypothetical protein
MVTAKGLLAISKILQERPELIKRQEDLLSPRAH